MTESLDNIVSTIKKLSLLEVSELVKKLEDTLGVSAAMMPMGGAMQGAGAESQEAVEEKTEFDVVLKSAGSSKINVIKEVRAITGLGLKEAKEATEASGKILKSGISKEEAEKIKQQLEKAGATVELA